MDRFNGVKNELYYTYDHEWIDFQGPIAYVGVCSFKLSGIKHIQQIEFKRDKGSIKAGDLLAVILSEDYKIPVHMPVDGEILNFNELLADKTILLQQPEKVDWVALIVPSSLHERNSLLLPEQHRIRNRRIVDLIGS